MKKILIAINILFTCILAFQSCENKKQDKQSRSTESSDTSIARHFPDRFKELPLKIEGELDSLDGLLTEDIAVEMSKAYRSDEEKSNYEKEDGSKGKDARSIWFSLETLKRFIAKIDNTIPGGGGRPLLGVRIYYAKYPKVLPDDRIKEVDSKGAGRHTIFMVPTYLDASGKNTDFNFFHVGPDKHNPIPYHKLLVDSPHLKPSILGGINRHALEYRLPNGMVIKLLSGGIQNQGGLAPPPAGEGTFPSN